jgi:hypothetical protein
MEQSGYHVNGATTKEQETKKMIHVLAISA